MEAFGKVHPLHRNYSQWYQMKEKERQLHRKDMVNKALEKAEILKKKTYLDGFALCSDYCFNSGPFLSPSMFSEFVTPYQFKYINA